MYCNHHKHTHMSNISSLDCIVKPEEYMKRAIELGHTEYFTTEHGYQGNIFELYTLCQKYNLKCIYGAELYYVDDRHEKDRGNYHLTPALSARGPDLPCTTQDEAGLMGKFDIEIMSISHVTLENTTEVTIF